MKLMLIIKLLAYLGDSTSPMTWKKMHLRQVIHQYSMMPGSRLMFDSWNLLHTCPEVEL